MSVDEDTELRDMVYQTLEANGTLERIKAELRATIFLALEEEGSFRDKIPFVNKKLHDFVSTFEGKAIVSLIKEFLTFFDLQWTLVCFEPEVSSSNSFLSKEELCETYNVPLDSLNSSVLEHLLKSCSMNLSDNKKSQSPSLSQTENRKQNTEKNMILTDLSTRSHHKTGPRNNHKDTHEENINSTQFVSNATFAIKHNLDKTFEKVKNTDDKNDNAIHDPFFDELPSPTTERSIFMENITDIFKSKNKKEGSSRGEQFKPYGDSLQNTYSRDVESTASNIFAVTPVGRLKTEANKDNSVTDSSLSSLKNLPPLNTRLRSAYDPNAEATKKSVFETDFEEDKDSEDYQKCSETFQVNSMNKNKCVTDSNGNSEESVEEDIDDEISVGIDDLLSSISIGDETTHDGTVSQISNVDGLDYVETAINK